MHTKKEALAALATCRLLDSLKWAAPIAFARTGDDYDIDAGHDQMVIGVHNFVYLRDLLDRVAGTGRFALAPDMESGGEDLFRRGISAANFTTMPKMPSGTLLRMDYDNSPGWGVGDIRILLQSYKPGGIDSINWGQRSDAKRRVADQHFVAGPTLFDDLADFELESLEGIVEDDFVGTTLVVAHAYDATTGQYEMFVGQSKNKATRGESSWHWKEPILRGGVIPGAQQRPSDDVFPGTPVSGQADELSVTIKKQTRRTGTEHV